MEISMPHPAAASGQVSLIGNPIKYSDTPADYRRAPPMLGQHTDELLAQLLELSAEEIGSLREDGVV